MVGAFGDGSVSAIDLEEETQGEVSREEHNSVQWWTITLFVAS